jgi:hypothetical protein
VKSSGPHLAAIGFAFVAILVSAIPASAQRGGSHLRQPASPPMKTANEAYWDTVRATLGPIRFPQATSADEFSRRLRVRSRDFGPGVFGAAPYFGPPEPVYVPVYVPGPVVYVPLPVVEPPATAPTSASTSVATAPRRPENFYVIPGCYAGNKPPQPEALPAGCDVQKLSINTW